VSALLGAVTLGTLGALGQGDEPARESGWIPVELYLSSYVYLRGTVNGVATDIVLDSGAGATVVDAALAERLGLEEEGGAVTALGVGGTQGASFLGALDVELGALRLRVPRPVKLDLSGVHAQLGRDMPVILGQEAFRALVVDLDYPRARVAFRKPDGSEYEGPGHTVPLLLAPDGRFLVEAEVEGRRAALALDTGSGDTLDLFRAFTAEHGLLEGRSPVSEKQGGGVGGLLTSRIATLRSVALAGYTLSEVPAGFPAEAKGAFHTEAMAGNLGAGILSRFRVVFDMPRQRLTFEPGDDLHTRPFRRNRTGLHGQFREGAFVLGLVAPGSPAAAAGFATGERITRLNGEALAADTWRLVVRRWVEAPPGTELTLVDEEGRARRLVTADYY